MEFNLVFVVLLFLQAVAARYVRTPARELREKVEKLRSEKLYKRDTDPTLLYPAYNLSVPIDHFPDSDAYAPHSNGTFNLRYWFDATYYQEGGPVIVLESGEDTGEDRLPYLQKGIVAQLIKATGGVGVILEHRYYGTSFPVPDLSTENLRFLTTEQALADTAYFAKNVKFEGMEDSSLNPPDTPWIAYGGSYAGAFVAFLRTQYPDIFYGAISSSGVTEAIIDYWQYFEPIRMFAPPDCVRNTQLLTNVIDNILLKSNNSAMVSTLKAAFGLPNVTNNADFANQLTSGITGWQSRNWDPEVTADTTYLYCGNMSAMEPLYPATSSLLPTVKTLLTAGGYDGNTTLETPMLNYIGWTNATISPCDSADQNECYTTLNASSYQDTSFEAGNAYRSWNYQVCTQWGYFQTGDTPADILPLISRTLDLSYETFMCGAAYNITLLPDVDAVNKYGGFNISYDRLAIIGGQADPWRPATPLADEAPKRNSTQSMPVLEIPDAVHHWDENGLFDNETSPTLPPNAIVYAQQFEKDFVMAWLEDFEAEKRRKGRRSEL